MHIYLAARYSRRVEMREVATMLEARGHDVVSTWIFREDDKCELEARAARQVAERNVRDIQRCDVLVQFSGDGTTQGGKHFELALAWTYRKHVIIIGVPEGVFQFLPGMMRVADLSGLGAAMAELNMESLYG